MSKIHFTVRYFIRGKMNRIRKVEKIKGTHLRYLCCEASHCRFALSVDGKALSMGLAARLRIARFFVLQCSPPGSAVQRHCPLHSSVLQNAVHRQYQRCVPPSLRALSTVSAQSVFSAPQSDVNKMTEICLKYISWSEIFFAAK